MVKPKTEPEVEPRPELAIMLSTEEFRGKHLIEKLAAIMSVIDYVPKRGWNDFHKYKYVMEGDLTSVIRPLLAASGIMIIPNVIEEDLVMEAVSERGGASHLCRIKVEYTVTDGRNEIKFVIPGYGVDRSDKSVYKAMTGSMKYALMKLFEVETGDDPERETGSHHEVGNVRIEPSNAKAAKGGHSEKATRYQLQRIASKMRENGMERADLLSVIEEEFGVQLQIPEDATEAQKTILGYLQELDSADAGTLLARIDAWSPAATNA